MGIEESFIFEYALDNMVKGKGPISINFRNIKCPHCGKNNSIKFCQLNGAFSTHCAYCNHTFENSELQTMVDRDCGTQ